MASRNLYLRVIFSMLFLSIYISICLINFQLIFFVIIFIYLLILIEIYKYFREYKIIPLTYVIISFIFILNLELNNSFLYFNFFIFTIVTFDTFSYLIGKLFGKKQLIKVSPNKTIEGFIGGASSSLILSILFAYYFNILINIKLILFIILNISFAFSGDIIESYFKRKNNLKNSSEFIPGHGGIFDRFDSFLFSIIFYSISLDILL